MSILSDLGGLLFPPLCPVCGRPLHGGEGAFCMACRTTAPLTRFWENDGNPLLLRLRDHLPPVESASAFLWFVEGSRWQRAIHSFKYHARWRTAYDLGRWYGNYLADSGLTDRIDAVVPVPLHPRRLLSRGYNQSDYIARGIAGQLRVPVVADALCRTRNNRSQTRLHGAERRLAAVDLFAVAHPERLAGCRILLVDDVITTCATIAAAAEALLDAADVRLSVAALALSEREFGLDR